MNTPFDLVALLARHRVAPNLLMLIMVIVGVWALGQLSVRFFPPFDVQLINVTATWRAASAEDVEKSLVTPLENEFRNVDNIKKMTSISRDGNGIIYLEFPEWVDIDLAVDDVKQRVDQALSTLPSDAETPNVIKIIAYDDLMNIAITGGSVAELRRLARRFEAELIALGVAKVEVRDLPQEEIQIRADRRRLLELNTTVRELGVAIAAQNQDVSAGDIKLGDAQAQLRTLAKDENLFGLAQAPIMNNNGSVLRLSDVAQIERVFADNQKTQEFDGKPAVNLQLQSRTNGNALNSAEKVHEWLAEKRQELPPSIQLIANNERWLLIQSRLNLLLKNGWQGLILVLLVLFLFLHGRVAMWVAIGIPVVFLGTLFIMQALGGSINMISMFALIMATGIIVDDAIVVGENAMYNFERGKPPLEAAIDGARHMVAPVVASTFTTIASFLPLFIVGGIIGSIIHDIPLVIVCVLLAALFECFFILPGHLYGAFSGIHRQQPTAFRNYMEKGFLWFQERIFRRIAEVAVRYRLATIAACLGMVILSVSLFVGGLVKYRFFPGAELNTLQASVAFISGTPEEKVRDYVRQLVAVLHEAATQFPEDENLIRHVQVRYGSGGSRDQPLSGDEYVRVRVELSEAEGRKTKASEISKAWEALAPKADRLESLDMRGERGGPPGEDLEVLLTGDNLDTLKQASLAVQQIFRGLTGVSQVKDDVPYGKAQVIFELNALGRSLGLTTRDVATQLRDALDGYLAQTFYEGVDEIEVRVLQTGADVGAGLQAFQVRLPNGEFIALEEVATLRTRRGFDTIKRVNGRLAIAVRGVVNFDTVGDLQALIKKLSAEEIKEIASRYGVNFSFEGQQADQRQTIEDMKIGLVMALCFIYFILTWVFSSWSMPLVLMLTMPLGLIGAVMGHWLLGLDMSILSFFGIFALMGIIINDSIVLIRHFNELKYEQPNADIDSLIVATVCRRLRAVLVTSLTTVGGLLPLMFEQSTQAQFLIPMAASICFGLAFATVLILLFTPACLSYHQSLMRLLGRA